jgi:hypothetical protein
LTQIIHSPILESRLSLQFRDNDTSHPQFIKNEIVKGIVLKSISSTSIMLLIKGKRVNANTHVPLSEGSFVTLKVENTHPNPILKLLNIEGKGIDTVNTSIILNGINKNLWKTIIENIDQYAIPIKEKEILEELFTNISKKLFPNPTPDLLKEFIDQSGMGWENKIRELLTSETHHQLDIQKLLTSDLKGLISKYITSSSQENELFKGFVSMIQNIQLLNHFAIKEDGKLFIPLPLRFSDGYFTVGQLLIESDRFKGSRKNKEQENGIFRISFFLELSHLGPLRADLAIQNNKISGRFLTVKEKTKKVIEKQLPSFISAFNKRGFSILHLECYLKAPKHINDTLIKEIIPKRSCNISLVA